eukprot:m.178753 g.178753  ORF g.178753 m.178753 type:complete len:267 (+) comp14613_c0_seq1:93-893(+)
MSDRKRRRKASSSGRSSVSGDDNDAPPNRSLGGLKLKISFSAPKPDASPEVTPSSPSRPSRSRAQDADSDEEWTQALESGELDDRGEIPSKPPKAVTARQRSMRRAEQSRAAHSARKKVREVKVSPDKGIVAAQEVKRRAAANRRKLIQEKQRRVEKETTVNKLLQKQTSSSIRKDDTRKGGRKLKTDDKSSLRIIDDKHGVTVNVPIGQAFPMSPASASPYPRPRPVCEVTDCTEPRRYTVAATSQSVCSLSHYKVLVAAAGGSA